MLTSCLRLIYLSPEKINVPHLLNELVNSEIDNQSRKLSAVVLSVLQWRREVAFAGFEVPIQMDVSAEKMIFGVPGTDPQRRDELIKVRIKRTIVLCVEFIEVPWGFCSAELFAVITTPFKLRQFKKNLQWSNHHFYLQLASSLDELWKMWS